MNQSDERSTYAFVQESFRTLQSEKALLERQKKSLLAELDGNKEQMEGQQRMIAELNGEVHRLQEVNSREDVGRADLMDRAQRAEEILRILIEQSKAYEDEIERYRLLTTQVSEWEREGDVSMQQLEQTYEDMRDKISGLQQSLKEREEKILELDDVVAKLKQEMDVVNNKCMTLEQVMKELNEAMSVLEGEKQSLLQSEETFNRDLKAHQSRIQELSALQGDLQQQLELQVDHNKAHALNETELKNNISQLENEVSSRNVQMQQQMEELELLKKSMEEAQVLNNSLKDKLERYAKQKEILEMQWEAQKSDIADLKDKIASDKRMAEEEVAAWKNENECLQKEVRDIRSMVATQEQSIRDLHSEVSEQAKVIEGVSAEKKIFEEMLAEQTQKLEAAALTHAALEVAKETLEKEVENSAAVVEALRNQFNMAEARNRDHEERHVTLNKEIGTLEASLLKLTEDLAAANSDIIEKEERRKAEIVELDAVQRSKEELEAEVIELRSKGENLRQELESKTEEAIRSNEKTQQLSSELLELQIRVDVLQVAESELRNSNISLQSKLNDAAFIESEFRKEVDALGSKTDELVVNLDRSQNRVMEVERQLTHLATELEQKQGETRLAQSTVQKLEAEKQELLAQFMRQQEEILLKEANIQRVGKTESALQEEIRTLKTKEVDSRKRVQVLQSDLENERALFLQAQKNERVLQAERDSLQDRVSILQAKNEESAKEIAGLKRDLFDIVVQDSAMKNVGLPAVTATSPSDASTVAIPAVNPRLIPSKSEVQRSKSEGRKKAVSKPSGNPHVAAGKSAVNTLTANVKTPSARAAGAPTSSIKPAEPRRKCLSPIKDYDLDLTLDFSMELEPTPRRTFGKTIVSPNAKEAEVATALKTPQRGSTTTGRKFFKNRINK